MTNPQRTAAPERSDRPTSETCLRVAKGISLETVAPGLRENRARVVRVLAGPLLTIDRKQNSEALGCGFRSIAEGDTTLRLPLRRDPAARLAAVGSRGRTGHEPCSASTPSISGVMPTALLRADEGIALVIAFIT